MAARKLHTIEKRMIPPRIATYGFLSYAPRKARGRKKTLLASCGSTEEAIFTACTRKYSYPMPAF